MVDHIQVEVAYATPEKQVIRECEVPPGTTAAEAVRMSGISAEFPGLEIDENLLGVFSRKVPPDYPLRNGDRVEIYRPLIADPKESRRRRAKKNS